MFSKSIKMKEDDVGGGNQSGENSSVFPISQNTYGFIQLQGKQNMEFTRRKKSIKLVMSAFHTPAINESKRIREK